MLVKCVMGSRENWGELTIGYFHLHMIVGNIIEISMVILITSSK